MVRLILILTLLFSIGCSRNHKQFFHNWEEQTENSNKFLGYEIARYAYASGCFHNSNLTKDECYQKALNYVDHLHDH